MKPLVIISSSDKELAPLIRHVIEQDGFATDLAQKAAEAISMIGRGNVLAILIDSRLATRQFYEAIRGVPHPKPGVIELIEPGAGPTCTNIPGAATGMLLERPVDPGQILDTLRRMGAERTNRDAASRRVFYSDLEMDAVSRRVWRSGRKIQLTVIEFQLLHLLMGEPTRVYCRRELIGGAWPAGIHVEDRTVNVHMGRLRRVLTQDGEPDLIRTVRGVGYALDDTATEDPDKAGSPTR